MPEVMITIIILGILAGIAIPSWFGIADSRAVDSAANQLTADLRFAHTSSTNQLTDWAVVTDPTSLVVGAPTGRDYYLVKIPTSGTIPLSNVMGRDLGEDDRAQIAASTPISFRFKPDGSIRAVDNTALASSVTITLHKSAASVTNPRHDLEVNTATSRVLID